MKIAIRVFRSTTVLAAAGLIALFALWQIADRFFGGGPLLPPPSTVFVTLWGIIKDGTLLENVIASLTRVVAGYLLSAIAGIPIGLAMGSSKYIYAPLSGIVHGLRPIPAAAWVPLSIILMGIGDKPAVFLVFIGTIWPIILNTIDGVRSVPKHLVWSALTMGASRRQIFIKVILPASLPSIVTGLRIAVGVAFTCVIVAELIAVRSGLGYLITEARMMVRSDLVIAGMIAIGVVGFTLDWIVSKVMGRALRWQDGLTGRD